MAHRKQTTEYTDVIVVGNGPAGISMSYFLSGYTPYFNGNHHPNPYVYPKLLEKMDTPINKQDLQFLCEGLEGRSSNPVALLFDTLTHADADLGIETPSHLSWTKEPANEIAHIVLGKVPPGGVWQMIDGSMQTLSFGLWMELPDMSFRQWKAERPCKEGETNIVRNRATLADVRDYYTEFVRNKKIEKNFKSFSTVTSVQRVSEVSNHEDLETGESVPCGKNCQQRRCQKVWEVQGYEQDADGGTREFCYRAPNVVLATGTFDSPNKLGIPGENAPYVLHSISELEQVVNGSEIGPESDPVLIVGAGLSSADAIMYCQSAAVPMVHLFRHKPNDHRIIFNKLPKAMYPEYQGVHRLMKGEDQWDGYESLPCHQILECLPDNQVIVRGNGSTCDRILSVSYVIVLIGARPDLSFLPQEGRNLGVVPGHSIDSKHNIMDVDPYTYQSVYEPGLFAMGPLVGDNFVRFIRGGALGIASHLQMQRKNDL